MDELRENPQTDDELRRQLGEQVAQLAAWNANKDNDESWRNESEKVKEKQKLRADQKITRDAAPSAFSNLVADIIAGVLAYLTWIVVGIGVLAALCGAMYLWLGMRAAREADLPTIALHAPQKASDDGASKPSASKSNALEPNAPNAKNQALALKIAAKNGVKKSVEYGVQPKSAAPKAAGSAAGKMPGGQPKNDPSKTGQPPGNKSAGQSTPPSSAGEKKSAPASTSPAAGKQAPENSPKNLPISTSKKPSKNLPQKPTAPNQKPVPPPASKQQRTAQTPSKSKINSQPNTKVPNQKTPNVKKPNAKTPRAASTLHGPLRAVHRVRHSPELMARLKKLWRQGADAKHRNDFATARRTWKTALQICPGHPGFAPSIKKLSRTIAPAQR